MFCVSAATTDVGRWREHNEDAYLADDCLQLYVVADGMGGHAAGEVAAREAVEVVSGMIRRGESILGAYAHCPSDETLSGVRRLVESSIQAAAYMVFGIAQQEPDQKGMGTTITMMVSVRGTAIIGSVGDSRAYLIRGESAYQVTEDHTLVQLQMRAGLITPLQARKSLKGNVITRAVGPREYVQVDTYVVPLQSGDRFLLCSDGLHGYLQLAEIPSLAVDSNLNQVCSALIELANSRGGKDNITCVVVEARAT
ncbi:MAG: protein phosphatase 2C domain-containing protein [Myxococcales bacterium]|nr:protein phosphatase 2C domain-containing protein [Myxococcales bacterium]